MEATPTRTPTVNDQPRAVRLMRHVPVEDRREVAADVVLISAAIGTIVYLLLRPGDMPQPASAISAAEFAAICRSAAHAAR